ncbi:hypothetical protein RB595_008983 [Gaeumannomyces hyphopodioides]
MLASGAMSLSCNDDVVYCGHTLKSMGWSADQIWRQLKPNGLPDSMSKDKIDHALFICEDRWYWTDADLHYKDYCLRGCQNRGSGKDDGCYAAGRTLAGAANGTVEALNQTATATATTKAAAAKLTAAILRA